MECKLPDIKVEKSFKDISSFDLFKRFCEGLRIRELPSSYKEGAAWTKLVRRTFRDIGTSLGYLVRDEDLVGEWLRIDQTWRIHESTMIKTYLAMETENTSDIEDIINDEVEKLLDIKSDVKLLIYYPPQRASTRMMHLSLLQETVNIGPLLPGERFVAIMIDSDATSEDDYQKFTKLLVQGYELGKNTHHNELGSQEITRSV